jgi:hypothetical protein
VVLQDKLKILLPIHCGQARSSEITTTSLRNSVVYYEDTVPILRQTNLVLQRHSVLQQTRISSLNAQVAALTQNAESIMVYFSVKNSTNRIKLHLVGPVNQVEFTQVNTSHPLGSAPTPFISVEASNCGHSSYDGSYRIHIWSSLSPLCYQESVGRVEENSWAWILTS